MEGKEGQTEKATPKKRRKERQKGNLSLSQEIVSMGVLILGVLGVRIMLPMIWRRIAMLMGTLMRFEYMGDWNPENISEWSRGLFVFIGYLLAPIVIPVILGAVIASMAQTGPYFSMKAFKMKLNSLNPVQGFKKLFSAQSAVNLVLSLMKVALIVLTVYVLTRNQIPVFVSLPNFSNASSVMWMAMLIFRISIVVACLFVFIALADWFFKNYKYEQSIMMTKQEVKDERKQEELSPVVRKRQYKKMREFSLMRMIAAIPDASVVITNPTHVAVVLKYDPDTMDAPKLTAKGLRLVAERIKKIARENNIPIVERPEMARGLYKHVAIGQFIPSSFYEAVAEVLAYLYKIGRGIRMAS